MEMRMRGEYFMNSEAGGISITARREKIYGTQKCNTYKALPLRRDP
jgi:hypothetical protein